MSASALLVIGGSSNDDFMRHLHHENVYQVPHSSPYGSLDCSEGVSELVISELCNKFAHQTETLDGLCFDPSFESNDIVNMDRVVQIVNQLGIQCIYLSPEQNQMESNNNPLGKLRIEEFEQLLRKSNIKTAIMTDAIARVLLGDEIRELKYENSGQKTLAGNKLISKYNLDCIVVRNLSSNRTWYCNKDEVAETINVLRTSSTERKSEEKLMQRIAEFDSISAARKKAFVWNQNLRRGSHDEASSFIFKVDKPSPRTSAIDSEVIEDTSPLEKLKEIREVLWKGTAGETRSSFTADLWQHFEPSYIEILKGDFLSLIRNGELDEEKWKRFCVADYSYLRKFSRWLGKIAVEWEDHTEYGEKVYRFLLRETLGAASSESRTLKTYLKGFGLYPTSEEVKKAKKLKSLLKYEAWFDDCSGSKDHSRRLASILPCLWVWSKIAQELKNCEKMKCENFYYAPWINNNAREQIAVVVDCVIAILYDAQNRLPTEDESWFLVLDIFEKALGYEKQFFEEVAQPVTSPIITKIMKK